MRERLLRLAWQIASFAGVITLLLLCWTAAYALLRWLNWYPAGLVGQLLASLLGFLFFGLLLSLFSLLFQRKQLEFFQLIIDALKRISKGDFSVSLDTQLKWERIRLNPIVESINEMAADLGKLEEMRQEFISNVSHEIQSPLTSISGFARVLKEQDLSPAQKDHYLDIIEQESVRLSRLAENMLHLASLDSDKHPFHPADFRLDKQLQSYILASEPQWMDKELEISAELEPVTVHADSDLLSQVWVNLLHNAVKFTPSQGSIRIAVKQNGDQAAVTVEDTGIGMSEESQRHLFERFYKADKSRTRIGGGSGLGLSISKKIVEMHQGSISVSSSPGEGTVMTVLLPLRQA